LNLFICLTGGLRWGFKPRDKNGLFPLDNYSFPDFTVRIINDKLFVCRVTALINIEVPTSPKQTAEFDLYLYNPIWDDDFTINVKVEIFLENSGFTFLPIDSKITVSTVNNITDSELNIYTINNKPINIFETQPMFLYMGPKLYIPFNICNPINMIELYNPDSASNQVILSCSVYEGDEEDKCKIQSKYKGNEAKAIKLCPPKPKEIDKVFSINKIPIGPYISKPITSDFNKYKYDYKCIIISLLGPLSIGLSEPTIDGEFEANTYKYLHPILDES
jgi:hypothetical protein